MENDLSKSGDAAPRPAAGEEATAKLLEVALRGVVKLLGAIRFYPAGHPTLKVAARDALSGFSPVLQGVESLGFLVRRDHFALGETKFGADNAQLAKFASFLFMRRVQRLLVLPDLTARDLWYFVNALNIDPNELQKRGGLPEALRQARVSTVWVNEVNLSAVRERKAEVDGEKQELYGTDAGAEDEVFLAAEGELGEVQGGQAGGDDAPAQGSPESQLADLLTQLQRAGSESERVQLLLRVPPLIIPCLNERGQFLVLQALQLFQRWGGDARLTPATREAAQKALKQSGSEETLGYLVALLCSRVLADDQREVLLGLVPDLGEVLSHRLLVQLTVEKEAATRRVLSEALTRQGRCAIPVLTAALQDERWYVVRNAVAILGEIRDPEPLPAMQKVLAHGDARVRREAIRAITRIGGNVSLNVLLQVVQGSDPDLRRQALLSLGALKNPAAIPALLRIVQAHDPRHKQREVKKEAIRALGEIGSSDAVAPLAELLLRRPFWFRKRYDELRAAAATAIGDIADPAARDVLKWAVDDRSALVSRAASQALKQLRRTGER